MIYKSNACADAAETNKRPRSQPSRSLARLLKQQMNRLQIVHEPDIQIDGACSPKVYSFGWPLHAAAQDVRAYFAKYGDIMQFQLFTSKSKQF
jgi:hypothetical protein